MRTTLSQKKRTTTKVAVKSYGYQLDEIKTKNYGLFIDYLNINLQGKPNLSAKGYKFDMADYGTKNFKERVTVSDGTDELGILLFDKRSDVIKIEDFAQFKVSNHLFYTCTGKDLENRVKNLFSALGLTYYGLNRLDVALDFRVPMGYMQDMYLNIVKGNILFGGRPKAFSTFKVYQSTNKGALELQGFQLGERSSGRFCRIYNKTLEMQESNKTYISDAWERLGIKGEVWRFEYQMNSTYLASLKDVNLETLFDLDKLFKLFNTAKTGHFELHKKKQRCEVNKMPKVTFINMERIAKKVKSVVTTVSKIRRTIKETLMGQKRMIKGLLRGYFSSGQRLEYLLAMKVIIEDFDLSEWYGKKSPFYIDEFKKKCIKKDFSRDLFMEHIMIEI